MKKRVISLNIVLAWNRKDLEKKRNRKGTRCKLLKATCHERSKYDGYLFEHDSCKSCHNRPSYSRSGNLIYNWHSGYPKKINSLLKKNSTNAHRNRRDCHVVRCWSKKSHIWCAYSVSMWLQTHATISVFVEFTSQMATLERSRECFGSLTHGVKQFCRITSLHPWVSSRHTSYPYQFFYFPLSVILSLMFNFAPT